MQTIQSSDAPIQFRQKGTIPWKTLVCTENYSVPVNTTTTTTDTFCGRAVGLGVREFTPSFSAVCEQVPTTSQVSYQDIVNWQMNGTLLEFLVEYPGTGSIGANVYLSGEGYITASELQGAVNDVLKFTGTFTGQGTLDTTP